MRLFTLQCLFGLCQALVPPGELVTPRAHAGLLLLQRCHRFLGAMYGFGHGGPPSDELLDTGVGAEDALFEIRQEVGEIGQFAGAGEESRLLLVSLEVNQPALHPQAVAGEAGHSRLRARESRLMIVPSLVPSASAASLYERPATSTATIVSR